MTSALPSRRDALLPQDITATLCKVHQVPDIDDVTAEEEIKPLNVAPVWHGMALDLMLGNLEQNLWGWSDPQSIYSLDYWCQLDDKLTFILVYDAPQQALMKAAANYMDLSSTTIEHHINNWMAYNGALLAFFLRNRKRCLMVNAEQVKRNADACLQKLQPLLSTPLLSTVESNDEKMGCVVKTDERIFPVQTNYSVLPAQKLTEIANLAGLDAKETQEALQGNAVENYLLEQLITEYPASQHLYAELQSAASLPLQSDYREDIAPSKVWEKMVQQRIRNAELATGLYKAYLGINESLERSVTTQNQESEVLLSQLHQVQEELERQYLIKKDLENLKTQQTSKLQHQVSLTRKKEEEVTSLNKSLDDTKKQLTTLKNTEQNKIEKVLGENEQLLTQLHAVQEELERYYLENKKLKQQQVPALYGAAERIKQELGYRLGATMIKRSRTLTGWLGMPKALAAERRAWHQQNSNQSQKILTPVSSYRDAHEAERVKRHLSYQLGEVLVHSEGSLFRWVKLPFALYRSVRQYRFQRQGK
ncbi:sulfotransferase family protein [Enterobacter sp. FS01]|nr:sulfotransferase family protein [Enterobacter sp. FS01]